VTVLCPEEVSEDLQKTFAPSTGEDDGGSIQKRVVIIITAMGTSNLT